MPGPYPAPISDATSTRRGLMGIGAQVFSGVKTFLDAIGLSNKTTATLPVGGAELEGQLVYNSTTKRPQVHDGTDWKPVALEVGGATPASSIGYSGSGNWADSTAITAVTVEAALDEVVSDLSETGGASKIGATPGGSLSGTTVQAQLSELDSEKASTVSLGAKVDLSALAANTGTTLVGGAAKSGMTWFQLTAGTIKAQLEELLAHINTTRPDIVTPTTISAVSGWFSTLKYAKDNGGWGHVVGMMENDTGGTVNITTTLATIPVGVRPSGSEVWIQAVILNFSNAPVGTAYCVITLGGEVKLVSGSVPAGHFLALNFPSYKCV
jgi:hypothetical protein